MKKMILVTAFVAGVLLMAASSFAADNRSEALFKEKCAVCHPDGGNLMNPKRALKGIKRVDTIIRKIRNGGGGMPAFDAKTISDADTGQLANYIINTFKK